MKPVKVAAVAWLTVRAAIRSRMVVSLLAALAAVVVGLPLAVKGDGSAAGLIRVLLDYTLGLAAWLLAVATLWAGCGAIANEIESKSIRLMAVKPVRRHELWLGKWAGLLLLDAALLALSGAVVYGLARRAASSPGLAAGERRALEEELLAGRRRIAPRLESVQDEVRRRYAQAAARPEAVAGLTRQELETELRKRVLGERLTVPPGASREWRLEVPLGRGGPRPVSLRFRLSTMARSRTPVAGEWRIATGDGRELCRVRCARCVGGPYLLNLPRDVWDQMRARAGAARSLPLVVRFTNDPPSASGTALFDFGAPVELLVRESGFAGNLARALLVILCELACVAAVGLTAGAVFSYPVAVFTSLAFLAMTLLSHYFVVASSAEFAAVESGEEEGQAAAWLTTAGAYTARGLDALMRPALEFDPIARLSDGVLVPWPWTGKAVLYLAVVYPGALLAAGAWALRRRELALSGG